MAKSRRVKPSFDRTPPTAEPDASAPLSRSEAPGPVIDIARASTPIATTPIAPRLIPPARAVSRLEHGIELMSRPFVIVIMLGVAALGAFRSRRALGLLLVVGALASAACNRFQTIWAGVEFQKDGRLKLAAEDPLCACLSIGNVSGKDLNLRSRFRGTTVGSTKLKVGEKLSFRFDWAGPENDDVYLIEATDAQGNEVDLSTAIRVEENVRWVTCSSAMCEYGDLLLNIGETGR